MLLSYFANDKVGNATVAWESAGRAAAYFRVNYPEVFPRSLDEHV